MTGRSMIRVAPVPMSALRQSVYVTSMCLAAFKVVVVCCGDIIKLNSELCEFPPYRVALMGTLLSQTMTSLLCAAFLFTAATAPARYTVVSFKKNSKPRRMRVVRLSDLIVATRVMRSPGP